MNENLNNPIRKSKKVFRKQTPLKEKVRKDYFYFKSISQQIMRLKNRKIKPTLR